MVLHYYHTYTYLVFLLQVFLSGRYYLLFFRQQVRGWDEWHISPQWMVSSSFKPKSLWLQEPSLPTTGFHYQLGFPTFFMNVTALLTFLLARSKLQVDTTLTIYSYTWWLAYKRVYHFQDQFFTPQSKKKMFPKIRETGSKSHSNFVPWQRAHGPGTVLILAVLTAALKGKAFYY